VIELLIKCLIECELQISKGAEGWRVSAKGLLALAVLLGLALLVTSRFNIW
jgi:hypothetical protein